jgi:large subunit ribosomal protein L35
LSHFTIVLIAIKIIEYKLILIVNKNLKMKLKTRKAAAKRIKVKKNCFIRKKAFKAHLLRRKSPKQLRRLSNTTKIHSTDLNGFKKMLPYS